MYGDSLRDFVVGFIVVDPDRMKKHATETGKAFDDALMADNDFKQLIYDDLMKHATTNKFNSLEKPKQLTLLKDAFSQEDDLLTPTMKLKRNVAQVYFKE